MTSAASHSHLEHTSPLKKARIAAWGAFSGQAMEYYDFNLYATSAALVFGTVFFPSENAAAGTMLAFATFAVGFLVRPLGGVIFGHLGDKFGRKSTLIATLLIMGIATTLIGVLPGYATAGIMAPVLLITLRVIQGIALGGEWGGASLVALEHAPIEKRAFYGSIPQLGSPAGLLLSTTALLLVGLLPNDQFLSWGWRLPFLFSGVLLIVALLIRTRVEETPDFRASHDPAQKRRPPIVEVFRSSPRALLFGIMAVLISTGGYYLINTFTTSYVTTELGLDRSVALTAQVINAVVQGAVLLFVGVLGTKRSPRRIVGISALLMAGWAFPLYGLMQIGAPAAIYAGLIVATIIQTGIWALLPALLSSQFPVHVRYTGISLVFQGGSSIGGFLPLIATALLTAASGNPWALAGLLAVVALITAVGALGLRGEWDDAKDGAAHNGTGTATASEAVGVGD